MYLGTINNTPKHRKYIWLFFLIVLGFCAFAFDYTLSRVTIRLYPQNVHQTYQAKLLLDTSLAYLNSNKLEFPAQVVEREVTLEKEFSTSGKLEQEDYAKGEIVIQSKREKTIQLPKGYKLIQGEGPMAGQPFRDKIIFALDADVNIPANGTAKVGVTAVAKGQRGNIPPGSLYFATMAQWNRERLIPKNETSFTGGLSEQKILSEKDLETAKNEMLQQAKKNACARWKQPEDQNQMCNDNLVYIIADEFSANQKTGDVIDSFTAALSGRAKLLIYSEIGIKDLMKKKLSEQYGTMDLVEYETGSFKTTVTSFDINTGRAELDVEMSGIFSPRFSTETFEKKDLAGFNETAIKQHYNDNPAIEKIEVQFFPSWRKTVPSLTDHVFIEIAK